MRLTRLGVSGLRNLALQAIEPSPHFTVLSGANGQGKTSWLEAIYLACRAQSFRTSNLHDVLQHGAEQVQVRAQIEQDGLLREQELVLANGRRNLRIEGKRPRSLAEYAVRTPVVVFHPGELSLTMGAAVPRRALLDRIAFFRAPAHAAVLADYTRAVKERQRALEERGPAAREVPHYEQLIVQSGLQLMQQRAEAAAELDRGTRKAFAELAAPDVQLRTEYVPSAPLDEELYARALHADRERDARRGAASHGPHRDDWRLWVNEGEARSFASQGQHRALVLSIKSAEIEGIAAARLTQPIVLLDDVSSELDRERTRALFGFLQRQQGQVFLTTTRPELVELGEGLGGERVDYRVAAGRVERCDGPLGAGT